MIKTLLLCWLMTQDTDFDQEECESLSCSIILLGQCTYLWGNIAGKFELLLLEVETKNPKYMHSKFTLWPVSTDLIKNSEETLCLCLGSVFLFHSCFIAFAHSLAAHPVQWLPPPRFLVAKRLEHETARHLVPRFNSINPSIRLWHDE